MTACGKTRLSFRVLQGKKISLAIRTAILVYIFHMGRKSHFSRDEFMDAAVKMAAEEGPGALTVSALAKGMNAGDRLRLSPIPVPGRASSCRDVDPHRGVFSERISRNPCNGRASSRAQHDPVGPRAPPRGPYPAGIQARGARLGTLAGTPERAGCSPLPGIGFGTPVFCKKTVRDCGERNDAPRNVLPCRRAPGGSEGASANGESPPAIIDEMVRETYLATMGSRK